MAFFDFLTAIDRYAEDARSVARLNERYRMLIRPLRAEIEGARVLDLAAHDGRWAYAFAASGAREVVGIEGRQVLIDRFAGFPAGRPRDKVTLKCNDIFEGLRAEVAAGQRYDIVGVLGILYHVMDHFQLFRLIRKLGPRLVIVDSEFVIGPNAVIRVMREETDNDLNAIPNHEGFARTLIGVPSRKAMELMAEVLGYDCDWLDWNTVPPDRRGPLPDYYREKFKRRGTCLLRPR
ncbi:MAG: hypothetical protein B7Z02_02110 [Rhodobacterales bacterium 32-67-9]|nr:MAG: hypothetical protein B7Z02_02110 [Rhodobacterales bacterium 32-67-9]